MCSFLFHWSKLKFKNFFYTFDKVTDVRIVCDRKTGFKKSMLLLEIIKTKPLEMNIVSLLSILYKIN